MHLLQNRRQTHQAAINALEVAIGEARRARGEQGGPVFAALQERNAALERELSVYGSSGTEQQRIISEYQSSIEQLDLEISAANSRIMETESALAEQTRENAALSLEMDTLRRQSDELQTQIEAVRALLEESS
jgi:chromosome segregation ATPase